MRDDLSPYRVSPIGYVQRAMPIRPFLAGQPFERRLGSIVVAGYYGWCFSDLEAARAFAGHFGGAIYKTTGG
jgi:hypothetical protein